MSATVQKKSPQRQQQPKRIPSTGVITIEEQPDGDITLSIDIVLQPETPAETMERIRAAIAGMAYGYELDPPATEAIGLAHVSGIDKGMRYAKEQSKGVVQRKQPMGFHDHTRTGVSTTNG